MLYSWHSESTVEQDGWTVLQEAAPLPRNALTGTQADEQPPPYMLEAPAMQQAQAPVQAAGMQVQGKFLKSYIALIILIQSSYELRTATTSSSRSSTFI